jgi:CheY-like chemotaxis protein
MPAFDYSILGVRNILVADDVVMNQELARMIMESWGLQVDIAVNGQEALNKVVSNNYDLILMDIQMPEMDGVQATISIRQLADKEKSSTPIVALTANVLKHDKERYIASGMNDILAKPFTEEGLFYIIAKNLGISVQQTKNPQQHKIEDQSASAAGQYDLSMVRSVSGGDEVFVKKMIDIFLATIPQSLADLQQHAAAEDWEALGKSAHKLKSTIDSMGINALKQDIRALEGFGRKRENIALIPGLVQKVVTDMNACLAAIRRDFNY